MDAVDCIVDYVRVVVFKACKVWVVLEQWLELSDGAEIGAVADCGAWVILDESLKVEAIGF